jgi:hypothetical protein
MSADVSGFVLHCFVPEKVCSDGEVVTCKTVQRDSVMGSLLTHESSDIIILIGPR